VSDFFLAGTPGYTGPSLAASWQEVVTPSGHVTMVADFLP